MVTVTCTCAANYLFRRILSYCRGHNVGGAGDGAIDGNGDVGTIRYSTRSMSDDHEWTPVIPGAGTGNWHFHEPSIGTMNARVESAMPSPNCISERERKESGRRREEGRPQRTLKLNSTCAIAANPTTGSFFFAHLSKQNSCLPGRPRLPPRVHAATVSGCATPLLYTVCHVNQKSDHNATVIKRTFLR